MKLRLVTKKHKLITKFRNKGTLFDIMFLFVFVRRVLKLVKKRWQWQGKLF